MFALRRVQRPTRKRRPDETNSSTPAILFRVPIACKIDRFESKTVCSVVYYLQYQRFESVYIRVQVYVHEREHRKITNDRNPLISCSWTEIGMLRFWMQKWLAENILYSIYFKYCIHTRTAYSHESSTASNTPEWIAISLIWISDSDMIRTGKCTVKNNKSKRSISRQETWKCYCKKMHGLQSRCGCN